MVKSGTTNPRPDGAHPHPGGKPSYVPQDALWQRVFILIPAIFLFVAAAMLWLGGRGDAPASTNGVRTSAELSPTVTEPPSDEALALGSLRASIESRPEDVDGAIGKLNGYLATARDQALLARCLRWKLALEKAREPSEYEVRLRGYRIDGVAYRTYFHARIEPGSPDVYVRLWRYARGEEAAAELVLETSSAPAEAWNRRWTVEEAPRAKLRWAVGDRLRLELRERDILRDDVIAAFEIDKGLSILLLDGPRKSPEGHTVELETSFAFGK